MNKTKYLCLIVAIVISSVIWAPPAEAQTVAAILTNTIANSTILNSAIAGQAPVIVGTPITISGQTFLVTTNATGNMIVYAYTASGTNASAVVPATPQQAMAVATEWINGNVVSEANFYSSTNELDVRIGAGYLQNSGQAIASIGADYYLNANWGVGGGVLQGSNGGKDGTAGFYAEGVYRKPIGNVAVVGGAIIGYDNWGSKIFGGGKVGLEYRQSRHLGEYLDYAYEFETGVSGNKGAVITAGIVYAF